MEIFHAQRRDWNFLSLMAYHTNRSTREEERAASVHWFLDFLENGGVHPDKSGSQGAWEPVSKVPSPLTGEG